MILRFLQQTVLSLAALLYAYSATAQLTEVSSFGSNPGNLRMYMYAPRHAEKPSPVPLVVVLHGCLQTPGIVAAQSGWNKLADEYGFNVLYAGQKMRNNPMNCFCWYKESDIELGKGENLSIRQMIAYATDNYPTDTSRIFVTGLSAGAAMAVVMMADYPEVFRSGAIFAGAPYKVATNIFTATLAMYGLRIKSPEGWARFVREQHPQPVAAYPSMIIYHGTADVTVHPRNGKELMKQWCALQGISPKSGQKIERYAGLKTLTRTVYQRPDGTPAVIYNRVKHLGHALMIDPGNCTSQGGKRKLFSSDRNFYSTYWTAVDFGLIPHPHIAGPSSVQAGSTIELGVPALEGYQYKWQLPKGCEIEGNAKQANITVRWGKRPGSVNVLAYKNRKCRTRFETLPVSIQ